MALKVRAEGDQKLTSSTKGFAAWNEYQLKSVMPTQKFTVWEVLLAVLWLLLES